MGRLAPPMLLLVVCLISVTTCAAAHGLRRGLEQGMRGGRILADATAAPPGGAVVPLHWSGARYVANFTIGTPPQPVSGIVDLSGELIWTQCATCSGCFKQDMPLFDPTASNTYRAEPCGSPLCKSIPTRNCSGDGECGYEAPSMFGDTFGIASTDAIAIGNAEGRLAFGCVVASDGSIDGAMDGPSGFVGLGTTPWSLVGQSNVTAFSYCLAPHGPGKKSALFLGASAKLAGAGKSNPPTPLLGQHASNTSDDGSDPYYTVQLEGIKAGDVAVAAASSGGGAITNAAVSGVPDLVFTFQGGATLTAPPSKYLLGDGNGNGTVCLSILSSTRLDSADDGVSILGSLLQENQHKDMFDKDTLHSETPMHWCMDSQTKNFHKSRITLPYSRASKDSDLISAVLDNQNPLNHGQTKASLSTIIVARGSTFVARRNFPFKKTRKKNMLVATLVLVMCSAACSLARAHGGGLRRGVERANMRGRLLADAAAAGGGGGVVPIYWSQPLYMANLTIGTPPQPASAIIHLAGEFVWTQCSPCRRCFKQDLPLFNRSASSTYRPEPCGTALCESVPASTCSGDGVCSYEVETMFGDTSGIGGTDTFAIGTATASLAFGCAMDSNIKQLLGASGVVGLGRTPWSLVGQMNATAFSYCLAPHGAAGKKSALLLGASAKLAGGKSAATTPLVNTSDDSSDYMIHLEGIKFGDVIIAPPPNGSVVLVDTIFGGSFLVDAAFQAIKKAVTVAVGAAPMATPTKPFDLCFPKAAAAAGANSSLPLPDVVLTFQGAAALTVPPSKYMYDAGNGTVCLAMMSSAMLNLTTELSILGRLHQEDIHFLFDLEKETLSFEPADCSSLS
uniref:Peptidase A1 domain-containing protein n=1 Tax=Oryza glumipatula TaxID=40148 RepID=A0A0E0BD73_9ORYZ